MTTVLLVGATGMLGSQIAIALTQKPNLTVKALIRSIQSQDAKKQQTIDALTAKGIQWTEGDLSDRASLLQACEGVDVIVSAVSGGEESVVTGQLNLLAAAETQGVQRMIPSDYSVDYRKLDEGDNVNLDMRRKVFQAIAASSIDYTLILNGVLTEVLFSPFLKIFDFQNAVFRYWGDGETLFDTTTIADVANYVAEAVVDPNLKNQALEIAGDSLTMKQLKAVYKQTTGKQLKEQPMGSVAELFVWIQATKAKATLIYEYLPEQYVYAMVSGKGKLDTLNARQLYPHITTTSVQDFIRQSQI